MDAQVGDETAEASTSTARASRFKFKSEPGRRSKHHRSDNASPDSHKDSRRRRKHKHRRSTADHDRHRTSTRDGAYYDPDYRQRESLYDGLEGNGPASPSLAPEDAFRESLFDALADDEGADYWEAVYGQPVHVYPDTKPGPHGKLERMTEEEYADYVRSKMWEKTHQHIVQEREAKEKARQERRKQRQHAERGVHEQDQDRDRIRRQMEESLRRGAERKKAKEAAAAWGHYTQKWAELRGAPDITQEGESKASDLIPWPVVSGLAKHISTEEIERFLRASPMWNEDPTVLLKAERVRWHPDKMQQRFRHHINDDTMRLVTAVFQIVDRLWNERRWSGHMPSTSTS